MGKDDAHNHYFVKFILCTYNQIDIYKYNSSAIVNHS